MAEATPAHTLLSAPEARYAHAVLDRPHNPAVLRLAGPGDSARPFVSFQAAALSADETRKLRAIRDRLTFYPRVRNSRRPVPWYLAAPTAGGSVAAFTASNSEVARTLMALKPAVERSLEELGVPGFATYTNRVTFNEFPERHLLAWHTDGEQRRHLDLTVVVLLTPPDEYDGGDLQFLDDRHRIFCAPRDVGTVVVAPTYVVHRVTTVTRGVRHSALFQLNQRGAHRGVMEYTLSRPRSTAEHG